MWTRKKLKMNSGGLLRDVGRGRRNTFTAGNGHHPRGSPGALERPGNRNLQRVPGTSGRRVAPGSPGDRLTRSREAGKLANPGPWPDKAPFISYMKGALLHSAA